jgi:hypothetical protein
VVEFIDTLEATTAFLVSQDRLPAWPERKFFETVPSPSTEAAV